ASLPEAELSGSDELLVGTGSPSVERGMPSSLEPRGQPDPGPRRDLAHLLRGLQDVDTVVGPQLGDRRSASVGVGLVPERHVAVGEFVWVAHLVSVLTGWSAPPALRGRAAGRSRRRLRMPCRPGACTGRRRGA